MPKQSADPVFSFVNVKHVVNNMPEKNTRSYYNFNFLSRGIDNFMTTAQIEQFMKAYDKCDKDFRLHMSEKAKELKARQKVSKKVVTKKAA